MKKHLILLSLGGLMAAATAQAQVTIYVTGATAFRANAYRSIRQLYAKNGVQTGENYLGSNPTNANQITWAGTLTNLFGSQVVTVKASYSGSVNGIAALASGNPVTGFLISSTLGQTNQESHVADLAFSDVFQNSTVYTTPELDDKTVGVQPFTYTRSMAGGTANMTNITIQQLQALISGGSLPLSEFTGSSSDAAVVHLVGRDSGSGTRLTSELDALYVGTPRLWQPDTNCNWTVSSGYSSGSGVVGVLNGSCGPAIGYLGLADAKSVNGGTNIMRYNGQAPFYGTILLPDFTPVRQGLYSFWSYEHLFATTDANANVTSYRTALASEIDLDLATSTTAIQISTMRVSRQADGGPITP